MDKRLTYSIIGAIVVIGMGAALFFAQPKNQSEVKDASHNEETASGLSSRQLEAPETFYDFGTVSMKDGLVSKEFAIKNKEDQPYNLHKLYTSCMCTKAFLILDGSEKGPFGMPGHGIVPNLDQILSPNGEAKIKVVFDPNAHGPAGVGPIERVVTVEDEEGIAASFSFKANVVP